MALKILIVDDEPMIHMLYKTHLQKEGFEPLCATTAAEGLEMARTAKPALIIMDVLMPGTTGLSTLRELKADGSIGHIPVVVMTAAVDRYVETSQEAKAAGAALFLTKPISPPQLIKEIKRLLEGEPPAHVEPV